jgi:hypothetical protein
VASHQINVQFCSNKVTGTMIAPAFALVWVSVSVCCAMSAQCRFFAARQGEKSRGHQAEIGLKKCPADAPVSSLAGSS